MILAAAAGCGGSPRQPAAQKETASAPPKLLTGHQAFQDLFVSARGWARDARPFRLVNLHLKSAPGENGRFPAWMAEFAAASQGKYRTCTNSSVAADNVRLGVFCSHDERYSSENDLAAPPFEVAGFKIDSDKAWEAAQARGGKAFVAKNPGTPVTFLLQFSRNYQRLVWSVCYDSQCSTSPFTVDVDAATGAVLKVTK